MTDIITPLTQSQTRLDMAAVAQESYLHRLLVATDIAANVALGGQEDETISTDTALMARKHEFIGSVVSRFLNLLQPNHGALAAGGDLERAQAEVTRLEASQVVTP